MKLENSFQNNDIVVTLEWKDREGNPADTLFMVLSF